MSLTEFRQKRGRKKLSGTKTVLSVGSSPDELKKLIELLYSGKSKATKIDNKKKKPGLFRYFLYFLLLMTLLFAIGVLAIPMPENNLSDKESTVIYDSGGEMLRVFRSKKGQFCLPYEKSTKIPEKLEKAVMFYEDRYFKIHFGINPAAVGRALYQNMTNGKRISGASTITMQLTRLMREKPRTYGNKIFEMFQAVKFEMKYSKEEILRKYLTYCPYGGNIFGYKTASLRYFRKDPSELSWGEAALLAILPNAPGLMHPEKNRDTLTKKRDRFLKRMADAGILTEMEYIEALKEKVPKLAYPFDTGAWHVTRFLKQRERGPSIKTHLIKSQQKQLEKELRDFSLKYPDSSITNMSAVVMENSTGKIRAWIGSQDFFDKYINGQVDGVLADRSASGMLQPFLYALSIDKGVILPNSLLPDIPEEYEGYTPINRDNRFLGAIKASMALQEQRTAPAVRILEELGVDEFYTFLKHAGMDSLRYPPEWYKFALVSGGTDVRLFDLAEMYSGLARYGSFFPASVTDRNRVLGQDGKKLISTGASWLVIDKMMEKDEIFNVQGAVTETCSRSGKDCWTIVLTPDWTVAFWSGRLSAEKTGYQKDLSNIREVAFSVLSFLPALGNSSWFEKPEKDLTQIETCRDTGYYSGLKCKDTVPEDIPLEVKNPVEAPFHTNKGKLVFPPAVMEYLKAAPKKKREKNKIYRGI